MVMASLVFGIYTGQSQFVGVAAAAFWLLIVLGIFVGCAYGVTASSLDSLADDESRKAAIESLQRFTKKKNIISRVWGWLCFIASVVLLAYSGWVFTAVCYALASLFVRLIASVVRDKLQKYEKPSGIDWADVLDQRENEQKYFSERGTGHG